MLLPETKRRTVIAVRCALIAAALAVLMLSAPQVASAATIDCPVEVTDIWIYARTGSLVVSVRWQAGGQNQVRSWVLCNLETPVNGIEPEVCSEVHAELLVAKTTEKTAVISFLDTVPGQGGGVAATCEQIWNFNSTVAEHFWYLRVRSN